MKAIVALGLLALLFTGCLAHAGHDHDHDHGHDHHHGHGHDHDHDHHHDHHDHGAAGQSRVVVLTTENFDATLKENEFVMVEFYAPWCGHCKALLPEYEKAAQTLADKGSKVVLAKVDCTVERDLGQIHQIQGYPTIKFFRNGSPIEYDRERTAAALVSFIEQKSGPATRELKSAEAIAAYKAEKAPTTVLGFFSSTDSELFKAFSAAAQSESFEAFAPFGHVADKALFEDAKDQSVKLFRAHGEPVVFSGAAEELAAWLGTNAFPALDELSGASYRRATDRKLPVVIFFHGQSDRESTIALATELAAKHHSAASFLWAPGAQFANNIANMGASGEKFPTLLALAIPNRSKPAALNEELEFTKENVEAFITATIDGTVVGNQKSEAIPADNSGPVKVVVAKTFNQIVLDATKDVLVEFYAPWCGHCKALAPIYDELATSLASHKNLVIAKIDATANWIPDNIDVQGFPTILLFPAGGKDAPVTYDGERTLDSFTAFLKANAKAAFTKPSKEEL